MTDTEQSLIDMHRSVMSLWARVAAEREAFRRVGDGLASIKPRDTGFTVVCGEKGTIYITCDKWVLRPEWKILPFAIAADLKAAMDNNDAIAYESVITRIRDWWVLND